ncbi:TPA: hypothetical protein N0F65_010720 [Lagenidium giganteum]|uniref:Uncharacterized protein n=1 Tax=Lagenidium giganteum TaxID=4803 RepID=A0AAV2YMT4_9STRA|nr:TPA: hypothetical protein N0F65_010720 [Lagenidium giganteum]
MQLRTPSQKWSRIAIPTICGSS